MPSACALSVSTVTLAWSAAFCRSDSYQVITEFDPRLNWTADRLDEIRLRATNGKLVPLWRVPKPV
jgi:multidrug efflux pump subunit AcrB